MTDRPRLLIFGLGYSASAIVHELSGEAASIVGTVRSPSAAPAAAPTIVFDGARPSPEVTAALGGATHLIVSIPPGESGDPVLARHAGDILGAPNLRWIGYLSTVGVYGDHGSAWVDEATPCHPGQPRSQQRLVAETAWQALAARKGAPLAVFRLAGIYGPGRNALANLADGEARRIVKPGQIFNRIHVADIAQAVAAALRRDAAGIFNVADDEPAPPQDVIAFAAGLMGVSPPPEIPFAEASLSPMGRSFYAESKRVSNARLKRDLRLALRFPTYRHGLRSLWETKTWR
jgi:nucleoside-diphosphate-sugar epimerase